MKVMIVGYSGSGKSTLAHYISNKYQIPSLFMDTVQFLPGWEERDREEQIQIVKNFLDSNDQWVIDGNYSWNNYDRRKMEADLIVFMNFNRIDCYHRAKKRYEENIGKSRISMTEGCEEKFDAEFQRWLLWEGRTPKAIARYQSLIDSYPDKVVVIHNQKELDAFMASLK